MTGGAIGLRVARTDELSATELAAIRDLMVVAFGHDPEEAFGDEDWTHALGGTHVLVEDGTTIVAHGALVERVIRIGSRPLRTGYVEAVATRPDRQGEGHGTRVMEAIGERIRGSFELGVLGTGSHHFYERLGWRTWQGPSFVRERDGGERWTLEDDGYLMVLRTPRTPPLDPAAPISCDWRPGDVW